MSAGAGEDVPDYRVLLGYTVVTRDSLGWYGGEVYPDIETAREELRRHSNLGVVCFLASLVREHGNDDETHPIATELVR